MIEWDKMARTQREAAAIPVLRTAGCEKKGLVFQLILHISDRLLPNQYDHYVEVWQRIPAVWFTASFFISLFIVFNRFSGRTSSIRRVSVTWTNIGGNRREGRHLTTCTTQHCDVTYFNVRGGVNAHISTPLVLILIIFKLNVYTQVIRV